MKQKYFSTSLLPTEPVGSIPTTDELIAKIEQFKHGNISAEELAVAEERAVDETLAQFEATGSPVVTDGEQRIKHTTQLPYLRNGPFHCGQCAADSLKYALTKTSLAVKKPVMSASALSVTYPSEGIAGYSRDEFLGDLTNEVERDIRQCLEACADSVQMNFTPLDFNKKRLEELIEIDNRVLERFSSEDRKKIGVHCESGHSPEVCHELLLPALFRLRAGRFSLDVSRQKERPRVLAAIAASMEPNQFIFVGVIDPISPQVESAEEVRDRVLEAARFLPIDRLGTTDDCGFAHSPVEPCLSRQTAFAKIKARVDGTALAREILKPAEFRIWQRMC